MHNHSLSPSWKQALQDLLERRICFLCQAIHFQRLVLSSSPEINNRLGLKFCSIPLSRFRLGTAVQNDLTPVFPHAFISPHKVVILCKGQAQRDDSCGDAVRSLPSPATLHHDPEDVPQGNLLTGAQGRDGQGLFLMLISNQRHTDVSLRERMCTGVLNFSHTWHCLHGQISRYLFLLARGSFRLV